MNLYWISRSGGEPEGPFLKSQIAVKWRHGQLTPADFLCEEGSSDWQEAPQVIQFLGIDPTQAPALKPTPLITPPSMVPRAPKDGFQIYEPKRESGTRTFFRGFWGWAFPIIGALVVALLVWAIYYMWTDYLPTMSALHEWQMSAHPSEHIKSFGPDVKVKGRHYRAVTMTNNDLYVLEMRGFEVVGASEKNPKDYP